ncbi:hypothetical protein WISP_121222 [Willisornis vidua]|uniref:C3H1-type domain-containing protein n=1 Tax=Willisornis vidua TaxID=1566151 RepID=A0ABQ9CYA7_9PASS|nr:hypothetical protein WISP_121222 [Willisornis vidua]
MIDTNDNTVTVCMDYIKGRCMREKCKYFHPPAHLQAKIKAAQHQANQAAVAAQAAAAAATVMAFPPGVLHPLPKRQALEKSNGASAVFNPSVLHYQQALANAQLQQHAAFIPTGLTGEKQEEQGHGSEVLTLCFASATHQGRDEKGCLLFHTAQDPSVVSGTQHAYLLDQSLWGPKHKKDVDLLDHNGDDLLLYETSLQVLVNVADNYS